MGQALGEGLAATGRFAIAALVDEHEPRGRAMSADHGYGCQHYRTYDPASGTYKGYDGQRHSCP